MRRQATRSVHFKLTIPMKVVAIAATAYLAVWAAGFLLTRFGLLSPSLAIFGIGIGSIFTAVEMALVAFAAAMSTYYFLERPLYTLTRAMTRAEEGDFLIRAPVLSDDEIGDLSRSFNRLLSRLTDLSANSIQSEQDRIMAEEHERLRRSVEEKSSIIERTNRMLEQYVKDLSLIYEIGQEVNSIIDLDRLYATIAATLKQHLHINEFALMVFDEKREELQVKAAYGFQNPETVSRMIFKKGEGITGLAAETGKKIYIKDTSRETRFLNYKGESLPDASSFLSVPLLYKDEVLGVVNFGRRGVGSFSYQDVKMLSLVAGQVALAIANARLYTRTRELSVKDELTGINNRRHFQNMLQMEWKRALRFRRSLSLIMVDVDHFKAYNDTFGHLQGDAVLRQIGTLLKRNLREVDTVARFGGEEFVLLLPDTDKRGAIAVAEKVRMIVEAQRFLSEERQETRQITLSAGVATYPEDVEEMDDLIDHADIALYRAKEQGRNRIQCFKPPKDEGDAVEQAAWPSGAEEGLVPADGVKTPEELN